MRLLHRRDSVGLEYLARRRVLQLRHISVAYLGRPRKLSRVLCLELGAAEDEVRAYRSVLVNVRLEDQTRNGKLSPAPDVYNTSQASIFPQFFGKG